MSALVKAVVDDPSLRRRGARDRPLRRRCRRARRSSPRRSRSRTRASPSPSSSSADASSTCSTPRRPRRRGTCSAPWSRGSPPRAILTRSPPSRRSWRAPTSSPAEKSSARSHRSSGPVANRLLASALRDPRPETVAVAARAIARSGEPGSAALLAARLGELDIDHGRLSRSPRSSSARLRARPGPRPTRRLPRLVGSARVHQARPLRRRPVARRRGPTSARRGGIVADEHALRRRRRPRRLPPRGPALPAFAPRVPRGARLA